jgi:single-strand DNA-binding protein
MQLNAVQLAGNLTRDPECRSTPAGTMLAKFSVACETSYKGNDGTWKRETAFVDCIAWAKQAEWCRDLRKGDQIVVAGSLKSESWEDKETGKKRSRTVVNIASFGRIERRGAAQDGDSAPETGTEPRQRPAAPQRPPQSAQQDNQDPPF